MMIMMHDEEGMKMGEGDKNGEAGEGSEKLCPIMPASADSSSWKMSMQAMMKNMMNSSSEMMSKGKEAMSMAQCRGQMMTGMEMKGMKMKGMMKPDIKQ